MKLKDLKEELIKIEAENPQAGEMEVGIYFNSLEWFDNIWIQTNDDNEVEIHWTI